MADLNNTIVRGKLRVTEDINANGNIAGSSITGNGSGLTNLNASNISSGTLSADRLATSGATAGSYGPSANATPAYGATFNVPYITVDNKGRVTAASTKTVKIPASDNTDTKVTSVNNHYSPTADSGSELTATLSGTAGAYAKDTEYTVLTGVKAQRDAKGHVTGLTYTAQKVKDTNTTYTFNGAVSTIKDNNLTASRALISNSSGKVAVSDVTSTELSYLDGVTSSIQTQLNAKLDKTTYEWNKEFAAGSNGAISLGRYNIYDSQLTFDITSTTNQSISGKLVIATQNGTIHQAKVFGDASGALVSKLIIYQSPISNSRSWVEVFCNFNGWSKNKVHIYAVALNSATVQKQMTSVAISNGVPAAANVTSGDTKWTGTIVNDFSHSHSNYVTTNTKQSITGQKTFDATPVLSKIKGAKVIGTDANGLIEAHTLSKNDVGLGNVDNTADKDKSVKHASSAGTATNLKDSNHSYTATDVYDYLRFKEQKIAYRAISQQCDFAVALADLTSKQHRNYGSSIYEKLYHQPGYVQLVVRLDDDAEPLPNKFSNPSIGGYSEIVALTLDISDMIPASSEVYPPNPYMFFLLKHITDVNGNSGFYGSSPIVSGPKGAYGNDTVTFNVDLWFPDSEWEKKIGTATITCNATTSNIAGVYATKDELTDGLDTKANSSHTHSISQITTLQSKLDGKANASHTHTISQINTLQDALDRKQNTIQNPCRFDNSNSYYVKLSRDGTSNYYVAIERGDVTYNGSTTQYPSINVTFPSEFEHTPTVIVTFAPTSNSTGTYEALKVTNVTSTGFTVNTRMSASISAGYFRVNWIAIYTV